MFDEETSQEDDSETNSSNSSNIEDTDNEEEFEMYQDLEEYEITECLADKILPRNRNGGRFIAGKTTGRRINRKGVKEK